MNKPLDFTIKQEKLEDIIKKSLEEEFEIKNIKSIHGVDDDLRLLIYFNEK